MKSIRVLNTVWIVVLVFSFLMMGPATVSQASPEEETIVGVVVKTDKGLIIEAEDGDYAVKGMDLSNAVGKMIEATGVITETEKGDFIEVKSFEELQE